MQGRAEGVSEGQRRKESLMRRCRYVAATSAAAGGSTTLKANLRYTIDDINVVLGQRGGACPCGLKSSHVRCGVVCEVWCVRCEV